MEHQTLVLVAYVSVDPVQHVAIQVKPVALALANVERPQVVSVSQLELIVMLQITSVNVQPPLLLVQLVLHVRVVPVSVSR